MPVILENGGSPIVIYRMHFPGLHSAFLKGHPIAHNTNRAHAFFRSAFLLMHLLILEPGY